MAVEHSEVKCKKKYPKMKFITFGVDDNSNVVVVVIDVAAAADNNAVSGK